MSALCELDSVSVRYEGVPVLRDISLKVDDGEKIALVGRSGAGKSTLLRLLYERAGSNVALVPQDFALVRALSVFHNVYMGRLSQHGAFYNLLNLIRPFPREVAAVAPLLETLGLQEKLFEPAGQLSGGQQQRTAVARALHQDAAVLIADEPVSSVDVHQSRAVLDALTSGHRTVVLAMHDIALAIEYADRLVGLKDGRIGLDCPTQGMGPEDLDALYRDPD